MEVEERVGTHSPSLRRRPNTSISNTRPWQRKEKGKTVMIANGNNAECRLTLKCKESLRFTSSSCTACATSASPDAMNSARQE